MSMETVATLRRMSREQLSELLLSDTSSKVAVIDVRDDDHVGGHIHRSTHVPSSTLDYRTSEIVRIMADREIVVFHCALSQQRGPSAALRYIKERENKLKKGELKKTTRPLDIGVKDGSVKLSPAGKEQEVYVLDKGFVGWQEKYAYVETICVDGRRLMDSARYGNDKRLTDAYAPDVWNDY